MTTPASARLGAELRRLRVQRGLSLRAFVCQLGLTAHSNLLQYELGHRVPPGDIVAAYGRIFRDQAESLKRLHGEALIERAGHRSGTAAQTTPPGDEGVENNIRPAMLPATVAAFTGRSAELKALAAALPTGGRRKPSPAVFTVIAGTAGVGKTALAVHFAHQVRERFPDGQLFVNLRGHASSAPMQPVQALAVLLHGLGVPAEQIPTDAEQAGGLYRSLTAERRVLILLDNAHGPAQVRPLLPAGPGCLAILTSRNRLTGLVARDGARRITLDVLTAAEARALLGRLLGRDRVTGEPQAVADLGRACARLPLALRIAAAKIADHPTQRIADYLAGLPAGNRLTALDADGDPQVAVRAAFDQSYAALPAPVRRAFRLLGLVPGSDVTPGAVAALAGSTVAEADRLLDRLAGAHLVTEHSAGRYTMHDLLRLYAVECGVAEDGENERAAALERLLDWYLDTVDAAARLLYPDVLRLSVPRSAVGRSPRPLPFSDRTRALAWLDAERPNLVAAIRYTGEHGPGSSAWLLADALRYYFMLRMLTVDWLTVADVALAAAQAAGEPRAQAMAHHSLASLHLLQSRYKPAIAHYTRALAIAERTGWRQSQAAVLGNLGTVYRRCGRLSEGIDHYSRSLALHEQTGDLAGLAINLGNLGTAYVDHGDLWQAAKYHTQALALYRQSGSGAGEASSLQILGELSHLTGDSDEAVRRLDGALAIAREIGDRVCHADTLRALAAVLGDTGRGRDALDAGCAAIAIARETGERRTEADALNTLGFVHRQLGQNQLAVEHHQQAMELARQAGERYLETEALVGLAAAYDCLGETEPAMACANRAHTLARRGDYRVLRAHALTCRANVFLALGQYRRAATTAQLAVDIHRQAGHRLGETRARLVFERANERGRPESIPGGPAA